MTRRSKLRPLWIFSGGPGAAPEAPLCAGQEGQGGIVPWEVILPPGSESCAGDSSESPKGAGDSKLSRVPKLPKGSPSPALCAETSLAGASAVGRAGAALLGMTSLAHGHRRAGRAHSAPCQSQFLGSDGAAVMSVSVIIISLMPCQCFRNYGFMAQP